VAKTTVRDKVYLDAGYKQLGPQKLWCQICDSRQVDSQDLATGKFFTVFGLERSPEAIEVTWLHERGRDAEARQCVREQIHRAAI